MASTVGNVYGFTYMQMWRITTTGIPVGQLNPASLANNTTSSAYKVPGTVTMTPPERSYATVVFRDGNTVQGTVDTGLENIGTGSVTLNTVDATVMTQIAGGNIDTTTLTNANIFATNTGKIVPFSIGLMFTDVFYSRASATLGTSYWRSVIYPKCTARFIPGESNQSGGENPMTGTLQFTPQRSTKLAVGAAMSSNQGWVNNSEMEYFMTSDYPYALTSFVQDASATTYITGYLPVSSAVTDGKTTNHFTVNGSVTAPTSISTSTGVVTLAAAGTAGQIAVAMYQTEFTAIP